MHVMLGLIKIHLSWNRVEKIYVSTEIRTAKIRKDHITAFVILDGKVMQEKNASMSMNVSEIFIYAIHHLHLRVKLIINHWMPKAS